ncbi:MAG TPA: hypothetical protein DD670_09140 [Planctomycetaceae bacterium]|nr:hypothetical protein [Planctomycetaceae bacterium]
MPLEVSVDVCMEARTIRRKPVATASRGSHRPTGRIVEVRSIWVARTAGNASKQGINRNQPLQGLSHAVGWVELREPHQLHATHPKANDPG